MSTAETEHSPKATEPIVIVPPLPTNEPFDSYTDLHPDNDLSSFAIGPHAIETHSIAAVSQEDYEKMLSKEGPIPQYDIDDVDLQVRAIGERFEIAGAELASGMRDAVTLRDQAVASSLADKEKARSDRGEKLAAIEAIKQQYLLSIEAWAEQEVEGVESIFAKRVKANDQLALVAARITDDAARSYGNLSRPLSAGVEALDLSAQFCKEAEQKALDIIEKQQKVQVALEGQREKLRKHHELLEELEKRKERIPKEMATLKKAEQTERERLFDAYCELNPGHFDQFKNNQHASLARREEIISHIVSSVDLDRLVGTVKSKEEEKVNNDIAYSSCVRLIAEITRTINQLEEIAADLPLQLIAQHDIFAKHATFIKSNINNGSRNYAEKASLLGPVVRGEAPMTGAESVRLGFLPLTRQVELLREILINRDALEDDAFAIKLDPSQNLPSLDGPFGEPVELSLSDHDISNLQAEQAATDTLAEKDSLIQRLQQFGRNVMNTLRNPSDPYENITQQRQIEV